MSENPTEVWETTTAGGVWIYRVAHNGVERPVRIKGKSGHRFKVTERDREASGARFSDPKGDPFLNGTFKRVDLPTEQVKALIPDYDAEQALSDAELLKLFTSSGNAFRSKVKALNERNARRLGALSEDKANKELISAAQLDFLTSYIIETYRPGGAPTDED